MNCRVNFAHVWVCKISLIDTLYHSAKLVMFLLTFWMLICFFIILFKFCTYMHNWDKTLQNALDFKNSLDKKNKRVVKICRFPLKLNIFTLSVFVNSTFVMINISRHEVFASNISPHLTFFTQKDIFSSAILDPLG